MATCFSALWWDRPRMICGSCQLGVTILLTNAQYLKFYWNVQYHVVSSVNILTSLWCIRDKVSIYCRQCLTGIGPTSSDSLLLKADFHLTRQQQPQLQTTTSRKWNLTFLSPSKNRIVFILSTTKKSLTPLYTKKTCVSVSILLNTWNQNQKFWRWLKLRICRSSTDILKWPHTPFNFN